MPRVVEDEYLAQTRFLNRRNVVFVRDGIPGRARRRSITRTPNSIAWSPRFARKAPPSSDAHHAGRTTW
jgi:hypothetical protein